MSTKGLLSEEQVQHLMKLQHRQPYLKSQGAERRRRELGSFESFLRREKFDSDEIRKMTEGLDRGAKQEGKRG
jgi:hypothetical protein